MSLHFFNSAVIANSKPDYCKDTVNNPMISLRGGRKKRMGSGKEEKRERGEKGREPYPFSPIPLLFPFLPIPYPFRRLLRRLPHNETVFSFFFFLQKSVTAGVVQREGSRLFHGGMTDPTGGTPMFLISSLTETLYFMVSG